MIIVGIVVILAAQSVHPSTWKLLTSETASWFTWHLSIRNHPWGPLLQHGWSCSCTCRWQHISWDLASGTRYDQWKGPSYKTVILSTSICKVNPWNSQLSTLHMSVWEPFAYRLHPTEINILQLQSCLRCSTVDWCWKKGPTTKTQM